VIYFADWQEDIGNFNSASLEVKNSESQIREVLGKNNFLLGISAKNENSLLEKIGESKEFIQDLVQKRIISAAYGPADFISSTNYSNQLSKDLRSFLNLNLLEFNKYLQQISQSDFDLNIYNSNPPNFHDLRSFALLDDINFISGPNYAAILYSLHDVRDLQALQQKIVGKSNLFIYNPRNAASAILKIYRHKLVPYILLTFIAIVLLLVFRYGMAPGLKGGLITLLGICSSLVIAQSLNGYLTVFNLLSVLLIIGLGIDYVIFALEEQHSNGSSNLSVLCSYLSTFVSFGLLAFSSNPILSSLGLSVSVGMSGCYFGTVLLIMNRPKC
jgi:predicted exporter